MLAVTLTLTTLISIMFFIVGGVVGWILKQYLYEKNYIPENLHPEMYDKNGNLIPDEILAVRFENDYDDNEDEED
jgi:hypothetical protein